MAQSGMSRFVSWFLGVSLSVASSQLFQGCAETVEPSPSSAGERSQAEVRVHSQVLSEDELRSLEERQERLKTVWTAFVRAAKSHEAYTQTPREKSTSDEASYEKLTAAAQHAIEDWHSIIRPIRESTIGYAWEGRRGELLYCAKNTSSAVSIVRNGENLELLKSDKDSVPHFIGLVRKSGEYIKINRFREDGVNMDIAPYFWNSFAEDGTPTALSKQSQVLTSSSTRPKRPWKSLGWLFPTSDGDFVCVAEAIEPIGNVLWVVKNWNGFDIVHSGPDYKGNYARISGDCAIRFDKPFETNVATDWSDATWKILSHNDAPAFDADALSGYILPARLEGMLKTRIGDGGVISFQFPPVAGCI
jgi:hypothetical protein